MQEKHLFEYAVIRVVPKVEREEFLNVGVILYCSRHKFLRMESILKEDRLKAFCDSLDLEELHEHVNSFERICNGGADGGPIGKLPPAERFRWLTATRSTILQTSRVHPGLCGDPQEMLTHLYTQLVL
jgi:hypothetical protein